MDLRPFLEQLRERRQLVDVTVPVDTRFEMTEIACRLARRRGPAVLFHSPVSGDRAHEMPVALNLLGSPERLALAIGREPADIGAEIGRFLDDVHPPKLSAAWKHRALLGRATSLRTRRVGSAPWQEVVETPDLRTLPVLTCWPEDAGPFITWPLVITRHPERGDFNLGLYRMQVFGPAETGMHWQLGKGGSFHHHAAERLGQDLPCTVALSAEPLLLFAGMMPLPEGISELAFAGFLRGSPTRVVESEDGLLQPASAEILLEGVVPAGVRRLEGPFGDHFGHYSHAAEFPVFRVRLVRRRRDAIYVAAVVGKPPQEDVVLGDAVQELFLPLLRMTRPEVRDVWAHYETGFHGLLTVSARQRYAKESIKTAFSLLGEGQLSLTKTCIVVPHDVDCRDAHAVLRALRERFDPRRDVLIVPHVSADTLDFTGPRFEAGSKMVLDLTGPPLGRPPLPPLPDFAGRHSGVIAQRLVEDAALLLTVRRGADSRALLEKLVVDPAAAAVPLLVLLSEDVDLGERVSWLWGWFTRFDPASDVLFGRSSLRGPIAVHEGPLGIDATWKRGYPDPVETPPDIVERVDRRWRDYGIPEANRR